MNNNLSIPRQLVFVREAVDDTAAYVDQWNNRRPLNDQPARLGVDLAVERIDSAIKRLIEVRSDLVAEIRAEDAAFLALDDETPEG